MALNFPALTFIRPMVGPDHPNGPTVGADVSAWKRMLWRWDPHVFPGPALEFDDVFNRRVQNATRVAQRFWGFTPSGNVGKTTFTRGLKALRGRGEYKPVESAWDRLAIESYRRAVPRVPPSKCFPLPQGVDVRNLGGVAGHMSRPLGNWQSDNAVDFGAAPGSPVFAVKAGYVSRVGGSKPSLGPVGTIFGESVTVTCHDGDAFFFTHMWRLIDVGEPVVASQIVGKIADWPFWSADHVHIGRMTGASPEELWNWPKVGVWKP